MVDDSKNPFSPNYKSQIDTGEISSSANLSKKVSERISKQREKGIRVGTLMGISQAADERIRVYNQSKGPLNRFEKGERNES